MNDQFSPAELGNDSFEIEIDPSTLVITRKHIVSEIGYTEYNASEFFCKQIDEILKEFSSYCRIRAGYRILEVTDHDKDGLIMNDIFFNLQKIVTSQLIKSEKIVAFICTIGPQMENWSTRLFSDGDAVKAYFVDAIASVAVEQATDFLHNYIGEKMLEKGLQITNRFSPGYCGWPVSEQHLLFSFFPKGFCGIEITDSALMIPKKSTSGVIGVGRSVKREPYLCYRCSGKDCVYRKYSCNHDEIRFSS